MPLSRHVLVIDHISMYNTYLIKSWTNC